MLSTDLFQSDGRTNWLNHQVVAFLCFNHAALDTGPVGRNRAVPDRWRPKSDVHG